MDLADQRTLEEAPPYHKCVHLPSLRRELQDSYMWTTCQRASGSFRLGARIGTSIVQHQ